jgi:hypothetical protein
MRYVTDRAKRDEQPEPQPVAAAPATAPTPGPKRSFWRGLAALGSVAALLALSLALFGQRLVLGFGLGAAPHGPAHPSFPGTRGLFADVSMVSPTEGWALAQVTKSPEGAAHPPTEVVFYHYQNGAWTPVYVQTTANLSVGGPGGFNGAISMDSATDGWAVAHNFNRMSVLLHSLCERRVDPGLRCAGGMDSPGALADLRLGRRRHLRRRAADGHPALRRQGVDTPVATRRGQFLQPVYSQPPHALRPRGMGARQSGQ